MEKSATAILFPSEKKEEEKNREFKKKRKGGNKNQWWDGVQSQEVINSSLQLPPFFDSFIDFNFIPKYFEPFLYYPKKKKRKTNSSNKF